MKSKVWVNKIVFKTKAVGTHMCLNQMRLKPSVGKRWWRIRCTWTTSLSLHGYTRNTFRYRGHAEYQLRADRSTWPGGWGGRNIYIKSYNYIIIIYIIRLYIFITMQNRTKELGPEGVCVWETGVLVGLDFPWQVGNWSRGLIPTSGQLSESEEKHLRLRVKQLICGNLNGMRIRQSTAVHTQDKDTRRMKGAVAASCSLGTVEQSKGECCCWLQRRIEGMWERRSWWEMLVEESCTAMEQGDTAESW